MGLKEKLEKIAMQESVHKTLFDINGAVNFLEKRGIEKGYQTRSIYSPSGKLTELYVCSANSDKGFIVYQDDR